MKSFILAILLCAAIASRGQTTQIDAPHTVKRKPQVNWLYGAYVPKDVPLETLTGRERFSLFLAQTFTTPGIYVKTFFIAGAAHLNESPSEWGGGNQGFAKRLASTHAQSMIQNSLSATGNAIVRFEPRYDLCRCEGAGRRVRHALLRNFLTYNRTERELRPQIPLYAAAAGAGLISDTWLPNERNAWSRAGNAMLIQAGFGCLSNLAAEFAPDFKRLFRKTKDPSTKSRSSSD